MNPSERLLKVMEYLMSAGPEPVKQVDIARDLGISTATLHRIIKVLFDHGLLFRTSERFVVANFRLIKNVPMSAAYLEVLNGIMEEITAEYGVYSETVVITGQELFWHSRTDLDPAPLPIRAKAGFRRPLYELDAMSRLYLARLGWDYIEYQFNPRSFHDNSPGLAIHTPQRARELIESVSGKDFDCDHFGNRIGLRRFALIVEDLDGNFLHFLTMAEPATPVQDWEERVTSYHRVLVRARTRLIAVMEREREQAEILNPVYLAGASRT